VPATSMAHKGIPTLTGLKSLRTEAPSYPWTPVAVTSPLLLSYEKIKLVSPLHIETSVTWICFSHGLPMFLSVAEKLTSFFVIVKK
jgi:hypothetical protein